VGLKKHVFSNKISRISFLSEPIGLPNSLAATPFPFVRLCPGLGHWLI